MAKVTFDKDGLAKVAGTLKVYNFDALSGEFTGSTDEYLQQGVGLPAFSCAAEPPIVEAGNVAVYRDGSWKVIADHRGERVYSVIDGAAIKITELGDYPAGTTTLAPTTPYDAWNGIAWVTDAEAQNMALVAEAEQKKAALLSEAQATISIWQTKLLMGRISDDEKARLNLWLDYIDAVQAVDCSITTEIAWPDKPE